MSSGYCPLIQVVNGTSTYNDVIKWKHFPRYWPFVRAIHRSPVNSHHKGQWRGALVVSFICAWINGWVNNRETGDLRRHRTHYDITVSTRSTTNTWSGYWPLIQVFNVTSTHDDVIKWKHFPRYWPFYAGNSPVTGEFPAQRPVTRNFDIFFDLRLNKRFIKQ